MHKIESAPVDAVSHLRQTKVFHCRTDRIFSFSKTTQPLTANMKQLLISFILLTLAASPQAQRRSLNQTNYLGNRAPLRSNPYIELPLGSIAPQGWLKEMLLRQKTGATGHLDSLYPLVMNERNGWLGGDGDQWERGPYWIDGLLPLAYILKDQTLIAKVKPWVEWTLKSQQPDGYFGPIKDYPSEPGIQRDNSRDWWPKMVMLKVLRQYYSATGDSRVIRLMTNYFRYQLRQLPVHPLDHWTFWARYRGGDNLMIVYWLYNITGDSFLLQLADLIHKQTFDYTTAFLSREVLTSMGSIHCVNLAQGIKEPMIYFQQHPEKKFVEATTQGFDDLRHFNGMAHGLYGGDEGLHGNNPTQGSELCSAVEMMYSLESILAISGSTRYADQLERIAFNALPAQVTDDFMARQYFQQANQVMIDRQTRNFDTNHEGTDVCYGLLTGYPCCTSNMHQGWPKFTQSLWFATPANGAAALVYAPSEVDLKVADAVPVHFKEETNYPFDETIRFTYTAAKQDLRFAFQLRIPAWCKSASIIINGKEYAKPAAGTIYNVDRLWRSNDVVELLLPMHIYTNTWYENSVSVERGPIVYALKIGEEKQWIENSRDPVAYGKSYLQVLPTTPWNYGLTDSEKGPAGSPVFEQVSNGMGALAFPWNPDNAPGRIRAKARKIPTWKIYNGMTGPIPYSVGYNVETDKDTEEIILIPYGCSNLRISQFPVIPKE